MSLWGEEWTTSASPWVPRGSSNAKCYRAPRRYTGPVSDLYTCTQRNRSINTFLFQAETKTPAPVVTLSPTKPLVLISHADGDRERHEETGPHQRVLPGNHYGSNPAWRGHTRVFKERVCERGDKRWHIKKRGKTERERERASRQKEKTEIHLFDTESLRKCRGMSSTPPSVCTLGASVCVCVCVLSN